VNQLIQVDGTLGTCSTAAACYVYDADGHRVERTVGATTIDYLYDLDGRVMVEVNSGPTVVADYVYAGGQLIAQYKNSTLTFVHDNNLGSSTVLTNVGGTVVECDAYYPFGELDSTICGPTNITTHKFTGKERDTESNLDNFGARYYSSAQGRFLTADWSAIPAPVPYADLHNPQTLNLYAYVGNNPLGKVDPDGHCCGPDDVGYPNGLPPPKELSGSERVIVGMMKIAAGTAIAVLAAPAVETAAAAITLTAATAALKMDGIIDIAHGTNQISTSQAEDDHRGVQVATSQAGTAAYALTGDMKVGAAVAAVSNVATGIKDGAKSIGAAVQGIGAVSGLNSAAHTLGSFFKTPPPPKPPDPPKPPPTNTGTQQ
jgi:RHS repeat-associated protein